jgi:hypothetical protein
LLIAEAVGAPVHDAGSPSAFLTLASPFRNLDWGDAYTFVMVLSLLVAAWYAVFLGLLIVGVVLLSRRVRRRRT